MAGNRKFPHYVAFLLDLLAKTMPDRIERVIAPLDIPPELHSIELACVTAAVHQKPLVVRLSDPAGLTKH
jgi:hypothetical protein